MIEEGARGGALQREPVSCDICGADNAGEYLTLPLVYEGEGMRFVQCRDCGHVYANPRPTAAWLDAYYDAERTPEFLERRINEHWGQCQLWVSTLAPHLPGGSSLLDVGCGIGLFAKLAHDHGWDVHGVEPNPHEAAFAWRRFGLNAIHAGRLDSAVYPDASFDAVTLWDVVEHAPSPTALLGDIRRVLKPGGVFAFTAPNVNGRLARERSPVFWEQGHLHFFSERTLNRLLAETGFAPVSSMMTPYMPVRNEAVKDFIKRYGKWAIVGARRVLNAPGLRRLWAAGSGQSGFTIIARRTGGPPMA